MTRAASGWMALALLTIGCGEVETLPPVATSLGGGTQSRGSSASTTTSGTDSSDPDTGTAETETGAAGCDPFGDPELECGAMQYCDFETETCVESEGNGAVDAPCVEVGECSPGLVCFDGFCTAPCDPFLDDPGCEEGLVCTLGDAPVPGVCLTTCTLIDQDCAISGQACNLEVDGAGDPFAVCTGNPGAGFETDPCETDGDCGASLVCTPANQHSFPCEGGAASCCTAVCDINLLPCSFMEPVCLPLGIEGQENSGYCVGNP